MKEEWKPEELLATSEEIREAVMPKSITPEMVGRVLCGLVDAMENVAAHREDVAVYPFRGIVDTPEGTAWEGLGAGAVVFCNGSAAFIRKEADGGFSFAGEDYNYGTDESGYYARTDRFYRCGAELYRAEEDRLYRLVAELDLSETTQELRREIVGLWDETAKIQAKLADLHSTEAENLLKRLGYGEEDIEEYIWAVSHLDLDISLEDLRRSVAAWEAGEDRGQKVAPKWTEEMEAGEETPLGLKTSRFNSARYYPHITTGKGFWLDGKEHKLSYVAGLHATEACEVVITPALHNGFGLGRFTGKISRFRLDGVDGNYYQAYCLKLLKSDIPIDLTTALKEQAYVDLGNVYVGNATAMSAFNTCEQHPWRKTSVPKELSETGNILIGEAFKGRKFVGETIEINTEAVNCYKTFGDRLRWTEFDDCDIDLSQSTPPAQWNGFSYMGYFSTLTKSRLKAHGFASIDARALVAYQGPDYEHQHCGVWEVDCPDAEEIDTDYCAGATCATFWNLGSCLRAQTLRLDEAMVPYAGFTPSGSVLFRNFIDKNEVLRESFRNSLRSWVEPLEPCIISLNDEQYNVLTEEDIALLTEKGYTISQSGWPVTNYRASFEFTYRQ